MASIVFAAIASEPIVAALSFEVSRLVCSRLRIVAARRVTALSERETLVAGEKGVSFVGYPRWVCGARLVAVGVA